MVEGHSREVIQGQGRQGGDIGTGEEGRVVRKKQGRQGGDTRTGEGGREV